MFDGLKKWWNRNEIRLAQIEQQNEARMVEMEQKLASLAAAKEAEVEELRQEIEFARKETAESEAKKNSDEPWVDVHSAEFTVERGVQIELDWNPAFIGYLKENGFKGKNEQIIVQKWLVLLYGDLITRLEEDSVEESFATSTQPGEFE